VAVSKCNHERSDKFSDHRSRNLHDPRLVSHPAFDRSRHHFPDTPKSADRLDATNMEQHSVCDTTGIWWALNQLPTMQQTFQFSEFIFGVPMTLTLFVTAALLLPSRAEDEAHGLRVYFE
jgi:hypothetical protein